MNNTVLMLVFTVWLTTTMAAIVTLSRGQTTLLPLGLGCLTLLFHLPKWLEMES